MNRALWPIRGRGQPRGLDDGEAGDWSGRRVRADTSGMPVPPDLIADDQHLERLVREGIGGAAVSVDIATADLKAMLVPEHGGRSARSILRLLAEQAERGVEVRLLHAGVPSAAALDELRRERPGRFTIRRCPRLHAKIVLIDSTELYLGSANLTGAGMGAKAPTRRNFELGLVTRDEPTIDAVSVYFNAIWEGDHCEGCGRRDVCPVPLEEPDLG